MRFTTTLTLHGKTATGITVPEDVVAALGKGKRPPVVVSINGYSYRSTVAVMNGQNLLPVAAEHRAAAGIHAGEEITVDLELDEAPREVVVPEDLLARLRAEPGALAAFEALSFSHRREHVRSVEAAKAEATRARRIDKVMDQVLGR